MITIDGLTTFFGWCSAINIGVLLFSSIVLLALKTPISNIHGKMFGIDKVSLSTIYFVYLGNYKIAIFIFNLVPYLALKVMS